MRGKVIGGENAGVFPSSFVKLLSMPSDEFLNEEINSNNNSNNNIQVNQEQLNNIPETWQKDLEVNSSTDCNY